MAFPPLVSSTPPPLDNFGDSEEDEFGDFTTGGIDGNYNILCKIFFCNINTYILGLSISSESPHKLVTPIQTPLTSQNTSPKVNSVLETSENSQTIIPKPTITDDFLILEKINDTVNDIKLKTEIENFNEVIENDNKINLENVNNKEIITERGASSKVNLVSEVSNFGESEQESSLNHLEDLEPLSLDLGDPTVAPDTIQTIDNNFYDYEQFKTRQNWVPNSNISTNISETDYFKFQESEVTLNNVNNLNKDINTENIKDSSLDLENIEKPKSDDKCIENLMYLIKKVS